jgi:cytochrome bd-type quinol oxidase subunit 1
MEVHHPWALTYVNLGLGQNISAFNISLVNGFNQTGNGTFCLKETGKANLEAGIAKANLTLEDLDGLPASLMVVQIASTGASLYNVRCISPSTTKFLFVWTC